MQVFILSYFYPEGTYAGIIGAYSSENKAEAMLTMMKMTDYPDCTFVITACDVE